MGRTFTTLAVAALLAGQPVLAQPMGQGGGGASPVMMKCRGDLESLCDGQMGMPGVQCLMENITDLSEPCADALDEAMANMDQGHGQDGEAMADDAKEKGREQMSDTAKGKAKGGKDKD